MVKQPPMKVKDLMHFLQGKDQEATVVISSDSEGNDYGTIDERSISLLPKKVVIYPWNERLDLDSIE